MGFTIHICWRGGIYSIPPTPTPTHTPPEHKTWFKMPGRIIVALWTVHRKNCSYGIDLGKYSVIFINIEITLFKWKYCTLVTIMR